MDFSTIMWYTSSVGEKYTLKNYNPEYLADIFVKRPEGHTRKYRSFVNKYLNRRNPDENDEMLEHGWGEFSIEAEEAFQKHLNRLRGVR